MLQNGCRGCLWVRETEIVCRGHGRRPSAGPATCAASVGSAVEVAGSRGVGVSFLCWVLRRLLELLVLRFRSEGAKEVEILVLRHQLHVLLRTAFFFLAIKTSLPSARACPC